VSGVFTILIAGTLTYVHNLFVDIAPLARLWTWTDTTSA
jgi:hypothetical protein